MTPSTIVARLTLATLLGAAAPIPAAGDDGGAGAGASPVCLGPTCYASVVVMHPHPWVSVRTKRALDGQALLPGDCDPCRSCRADVEVRLSPAAQGATLTAWEWGHVPTEAERDANAPIGHTTLQPGQGTARRPLSNECSGLMSVGPGSDILTLQLVTPQYTAVTTVWLSCDC